MQRMWLLTFNLWSKTKRKYGHIKQYIHLQNGLKAKQMMIIRKIILEIIIKILVLIMIITVIIIIIIIKQTQNHLTEGPNQREEMFC